MIKERSSKRIKIPQLTRKLLKKMGHGCKHRVEFVVIKVVNITGTMWERDMRKARAMDLKSNLRKIRLQMEGYLGPTRSECRKGSWQNLL